MTKTALLIGGRGAMGSAVAKAFLERNWRAITVDFGSLTETPLSSSTIQEILLDSRQSPLEQVRMVKHVLKGSKVDSLDCIVNAAGGWAPGTIDDENVMETADLMWNFNVRSALMGLFIDTTAYSIAGHIGSQLLTPGKGVLVLTGAKVARGPCAGMLSYAVRFKPISYLKLSKAAVHYLVDSFSSKDGVSQFPDGIKVGALLPITIDTPANRQAMPQADHSTWTPPSAIASQIMKWAEHSEELKNGGLYTIETSSKGTFVILQ